MGNVEEKIVCGLEQVERPLNDRSPESASFNDSTSLVCSSLGRKGRTCVVRCRVIGAYDAYAQVGYYILCSFKNVKRQIMKLEDCNQNGLRIRMESS